MKKETIIFVQGKVQVIRKAIEDMIGVYSITNEFNSQLKESVCALNRAEVALRKEDQPTNGNLVGEQKQYQQINDKIVLKLEYIWNRLNHNTGTEWKYECIKAANECMSLLKLGKK